jgi:uroporphyrinogen decarboxylase
MVAGQPRLTSFLKIKRPGIVSAAGKLLINSPARNNMYNRLYQSDKRIPRGEMWLGHGLFRDLGWKDDLESRLRLCHDLAMDIVFLPVASPQPYNHLFDYRFFSPDEASQPATKDHGLLVGVIIDGLFQHLSQNMGLQHLLHQWLTPGIAETLHEEAAEVGQLVSACLECKPDALVIADDIAYHRSTFVNPTDLESLYTFYRDWVQQAHEQDIPVLFHSDGNLSDIFSNLLACGFDGLAGCQLEYLGPSVLREQHQSRMVLLAGVPDNLLETDELDLNHKKQFIELLADLTSAGHLVLCSAGGLSSARHLGKLRTLYRWADEVRKP